MSRKVEDLDNLDKIITLPLGSTFGMFIENRMDAFTVAGYLDRTAKASADPYDIATVMIPTYPMVCRDHADASRDLVYEDRGTGLMRVLYERDLKGPIQGLPWRLNRAVILPWYLYNAGAALCFDACFVFLNRSVGSIVNEYTEQANTESFFISMNELNKSQL